MKRKKIIIISIVSVILLIVLGLVSFFVIKNLLTQKDIVDLDSIYISDDNNTPHLESDSDEVLNVQEDVNVDKVGEILTDENRKVVTFEKDLSEEEKTQIEEEYNLTFTDDQPVNGTYTVITSEDSNLENLEEDTLVDSVETDIPVKMFADTVDWGVLRVGASKVWDNGTGSGIILFGPLYFRRWNTWFSIAGIYK